MKQEKICLLLEDDRDDQAYFLDTLHCVSRKAGCYTVSNGEEGLHMLREQGLRPDYIFTDIHMPRMDGYRFIELVKGSPDLSHIPVIVYSTLYSASHLSRLKRLGVQACYSKARYQLLPAILRQYFI